MNEPHPNATAGIDQTVLDRLVDGELDGPARAAALGALEAEPGGWRRCALAFLEAQAWRDASAADVKPAVGVVRLQTTARRTPFVRHGLGLAAAAAIAFSAGFVARNGGPPREVSSMTRSPVTGATEPAGSASSPMASASPGSVVAADPAAAPHAVPEYLRRRMEREGYEVTGDRQLVPVALEDGRKVAVPVETVSYRYVGRRIH